METVRASTAAGGSEDPYIRVDNADDFWLGPSALKVTKRDHGLMGGRDRGDRQYTERCGPYPAGWVAEDVRQLLFSVSRSVSVFPLKGERGAC